MPDAYILNQAPNGYGAAMSLIVEMLVSAGWNYRGSGDGLAAYSATGKVFTGTGAGATQWNNNRAWARVADPADGREICIQHNAAGGIRLKCSRSAKFTGGAPSATVVPSATDERVLWGSGTDATPTLSAWFGAGTTTAGCRYQGAAKAAAPYGFWMASNVFGGAIQCGLMMDPVTSVPEDIDPVVWHIGTTAAFQNAGFGFTNATTWPAPGGTTQGIFAHMDALASSFVGVQPGTYCVGLVGTGTVPASTCYVTSSLGLNLNPFNSKHEALPISYLRPTPASTNIGFKGFSTLARWTCSARLTFQDCLDNKNWICVGACWLPWDGATSPLN